MCVCASKHEYVNISNVIQKDFIMCQITRLRKK